MRIVVLIVVVFVAVVVMALLYIRLAPMDAESWHVDPATAPRPSSPNAYILRDAERADAPAPVFPASLAETARALQAVVAGEPRVTRLVGDPNEGHVTYVQRSRLMGFPDAVSIRLEAADEGGTRVSVFSRSRFGYGDGGVNAARVNRWMAALSEALGP